MGSDKVVVIARPDMSAEELADELAGFYLHESDVVLGDFLDYVYVIGAPMNMIVMAYAILKDRIDGDKIVITVEGTSLPLDEYINFETKNLL